MIRTIRKERIKELLERAAVLDPVGREKLLERECGNDEALRREIEELLAADENSPHLSDSFAFRVGELDETLGKIFGGRYRIIESLGKGGMGQVYLAEDTEIPTLKFAIKIFEEGFAKEVEALARVRSNHVVKIITTGKTDDGRPYMVMEYLTGQTLADLLEKRSRLPQDEIAQLMRKIGEAATELHETRAEPDGQGIIHRDLKPSNIMVERRRESWQIKLFDLGIARLQNPVMGKATSKHVAMGTPLYMAPELFHGTMMSDFGCPAKSLKETISPATDIYSLGVIAYEMLVGKHPFRAAGSPANVAIMQRENRYVEELNQEPGIPVAATRAVLKAMAFCPDQRYQKAEEFGEQLAQALTARPKPRTRYASVAVLSLLLLLLLGFGALKWFSRDASKPVNNNSPVADSGNNTNRAVKGDGTGGDETVETKKPDGRTSTSQATMREVAYWFVTRQMRNGELVGEPLTITAEDGIRSGWNFKVYVNSSQHGYLYLINDGPSAEGESLQVLFPIPNDPARRHRLQERRNNGTSEVKPNQTLEAFSGRVKNVSGSEQLWLVWSTDRIPALEYRSEYAAAKHEGKVTSQDDMEAVRAFLSQLKRGEVTYDEQKRAVLRGEGNVVAQKVLLRRV